MIPKIIRFIIRFLSIMFSNGIILYLISSFLHNELWFSLVSNWNPNYMLVFGVDIIWLMLIWFVFWFFDTIIKYIVMLVSLPIRFLTLWLFSFAINIIILYGLQMFVKDNSDILWYTIELWNLIQTLILSFILSVSTWICHFVVKKIV